MKITSTIAFLVLILCCITNAHADTFGSGANQFDIDFVTIGNPGNADDTTGDPNPAGKVDYTYRIGKFEISEDMINRANAEGGLGLTHNHRGANKPATSISWLEAARFVNWLNTDSGSTPAYKFDGNGNFQLWQPGDAGYNPDNLYRNSQAKYFLPSVDEWYKAAFYNAGTASYGDYPTANGLVPIAVASGTAANTAVYSQPFGAGPADITQAGGLSPYGTMGQGGNVLELEETDFDLMNDSSSSARGVRGGYWFNGPLVSFFLSSSDRGFSLPYNEGSHIGFRVASIASIPEPGSMTLLLCMGAAGLVLRRRFGRNHERGY